MTIPNALASKQTLEFLHGLRVRQSEIEKELNTPCGVPTASGDPPDPIKSQAGFTPAEEDQAYAEAGRLIASGQSDEAIEQLRKLTYGGTIRWDIYNDLGVLLLNEGAHAEACQVLKAAASLEFSSTHALRNLIVAYVQQGEIANALAATGLLLRRDPNTPDIPGFLRDLLLEANPRLDDYAWLSSTLACTLNEYSQLKTETITEAPHRKANKIKAQLYDWLTSQIGMTPDLFELATNTKLMFHSPPTRSYCIFCKQDVDNWLPYRDHETSPFVAGLGTIGSNTSRFWCPKCFSHDRERHLLLYLSAQNLLQEFPGTRILHIAPEIKFSTIIESLYPAEYIKGDLYPTDNQTEKINVEALTFEANYFDWVFCNHVLEHVELPQLALQELYRVLKPGGRLVCQTPYAEKLSDTFESAHLKGEDERFFYYGQEDHLRLFGNNIDEVIRAEGFEGELLEHNTLLGDIDPALYGVNEYEPFFLFRKPRP